MHAEKTSLTSKAAHINHLAMKHQVSVCQIPANHFWKNPMKLQVLIKGMDMKKKKEID